MRKEWTHYNSLRPRTEGTQDKYYISAEKLKDEIESTWASQCEDEKLVRLHNLDKTHTFIFTIKNDQNCALPSPSNDCGIFVLYFMKMLSKGKQLPEKWLKNEVYRYRARMLMDFMEDSESYVTKFMH